MKSLIFVLTTLLVFSCSEKLGKSTDNSGTSEQQSASIVNIQDISADSAFALIQMNTGNPDFVILDVRTAGEFQQGHIENAMLIDFQANDFRDKLSTLDKSKTYLLHCRSGGRSSKALKTMQALGFQKIYHLNRGMLEWQEKELSVKKK